MSALERVEAVLRGARFSYSNEDDLQEGIAAALRARRMNVEREVNLTRHRRIDLLVDRVGIEVKVAGRVQELERQIRGYLKSERLDGLIVVTNRVRHLRLPALVEGKPVRVVTLAGSSL